ncbi:16955_t:CDS:2 [Dentiscutata erythropus]|uniref:16955_t:CDS:1 n=1 Tax=Dentiscutata erythropus TaxID=1348616 RepID=A0A9N9B8C8_9GLOM|nr:16955_t:CDS:2 [Dentiscutata erythropus]
MIRLEKQKPYHVDIEKVDIEKVDIEKVDIEKVDATYRERPSNLMVNILSRIINVVCSVDQIVAKKDSDLKDERKAPNGFKNSS